MKSKEDIDLSKALDKADSKSSQREKRTPAYFPETPKIIRFIMDHSKGLVKSTKQAHYVVLGFVVLVLIAIFALFILSGGGREVEIIMPPAEVPSGETIPSGF